MGNYEFYHSPRWIMKREHILRRDGYQCREAKRFGRMEEATTVHHIHPLEEYPEYAWEDWNLIALSRKSHNAMHDRATNALTERGEWWKRRTIPPPKPGEKELGKDSPGPGFPTARDF